MTGSPSTAITGAEEIGHYDEVATTPARYEDLAAKIERVRSLGSAWAVPVVGWLDTVHDCAAQADVYIHLSPCVAGGRVLQIGGTGLAALKALVGGADSAVLVTPSAGEAALAETLASDFGFAGRFTALVGFAEDLPLPDASCTAVISEACLHHTNVPQALAEAHRVLVPGGRFGAWDPWKARLYEVGIKVFGKRDPDVLCRPMEPGRVAGLDTIFAAGSEVRLHGAITRYPGVVWARYVRTPSIAASYRVTRLDDRLSRGIDWLERNGSSCAILAIK